MIRDIGFGDALVVRINGVETPLEWSACRRDWERTLVLDLHMPGYEAYLRAAEEINNVPSLDSVMRTWSKT